MTEEEWLALAFLWWPVPGNAEQKAVLAEDVKVAKALAKQVRFLALGFLGLGFLAGNVLLRQHGLTCALPLHRSWRRGRRRSPSSRSSTGRRGLRPWR